HPRKAQADAVDRGDDEREHNVKLQLDRERPQMSAVLAVDRMVARDIRERRQGHEEIHRRAEWFASLGGEIAERHDDDEQRIDSQHAVQIEAPDVQLLAEGDHGKDHAADDHEELDAAMALMKHGYLNRRRELV